MANVQRRTDRPVATVVNKRLYGKPRSATTARHMTYRWQIRQLHLPRYPLSTARRNIVNCSCHRRVNESAVERSQEERVKESTFV